MHLLGGVLGSGGEAEEAEKVWEEVWGAGGGGSGITDTLLLLSRQLLCFVVVNSQVEWLQLTEEEKEEAKQVAAIIREFYESSVFLSESPDALWDAEGEATMRMCENIVNGVSVSAECV